ncbi:MAG: DUF2726 domain-containing protein [Betaproteobacteria bacterium]|nr:DUF2726 domain-containing protein [Betaproteobacteria bacterium]
MPILDIWSLAGLAIALLLGVVLLVLRWRRKTSTPELPNDWALTARPVFSTEEKRLYRQLRDALPHHIVLSKLPLVRFCQPTHGDQVRYWYRLLGSAHVTFAICSTSGRVLAAVDLEAERSTPSRAQQIKQSVLDACRVRYLRCGPDKLPSAAVLQNLLPLPALTARMASVPLPMAHSRERLTSTVRSRRQERTNLWQDSTFADSRYSSLLPPLDLGEDAGNAPGSSRPFPLKH